MNKILVATDFSAASKHALDLACMIAQLSEDTITLFHVINSHTKSLLSQADKQLEELDSYMEEISQFAAEEFDVNVECKTKEGSIFTDINEVANNGEYRLILMGTHGVRGIRQNLFGADILKIARKAPVPILAVPDKTALNNFFDKIVFPYGGHTQFESKINAAAFFGELFNADIHIYCVDRDGMPVSDQCRKNIEKAKKHFDSKGISYTSIEEKMDDFSIGFAHQTIQYAQKVDAKIIAVMSTTSKEFAFISDVDKEALINNEEGIGILLTAE